MPSRFQLVPTPNPLEFQVAITVPDEIVNKKLALLPKTDVRPDGLLLEKYTPYKQFVWAGTLARVEEFGNYRYVANRKPTAGEVTFFFAKNRTDEERDTPFDEWFDTQDFVWPAVLLDLYLIRSSFNISSNDGTETQNAARYIPKYRHLPSMPYNSKVRIRQYLSDTPWPPNKITHPQPVPTDVSGSFLGVQVNFPRCLHRRVVFPELIPGAAIVYGAGMEGSDRNGTPREQVFPATNFTNRTAFYLQDKVQRTDGGMYLREAVKIYPPPSGEATQE